MQLRPYQGTLIEMTRRAFSAGSKSPLIVAPCGSGKTVCFADMATRHIEKSPDNHVWFLVHRKELIDQTEATFKTMDLPMDNIFIGMVQSISRKPDKFKKPTLIIFDEAHHATAKTWTNIIDYFEGVPVVGLTATPIRTNGDSLGGVFDNLIEGVDSEFLLDNGYLSQYDYYAPKLNIPTTFKSKGADFDTSDIAEQFSKAKIYGDVLKYVDQERKTIIYCPTIEFSKKLAEQIPGAVHFDGGTNKKERDEIISRFRTGEIRVLLNVDLIGEGFDVPDCDCVILLRPTMSTALYIQQSMRCLRPAPGKRAVIYDMVGNAYRHGLPTERRAWSLDGKVKCRNKDAEPDVIVRQCQECFRVYSGVGTTCPYCGAMQPKTKRQIEQEEQAELERITEIKKKESRRAQGRAQTEEQLITLAKTRGYKNPVWWARMIMRSRKK